MALKQEEIRTIIEEGKLMVCTRGNTKLQRYCRQITTAMI